MSVETYRELRKDLKKLIRGAIYIAGAIVFVYAVLIVLFLSGVRF